jgi:integrase/recombinase XerD
MKTLEQYREHLTQLGKSKNTIDGYILDVSVYLKWLNKEITYLTRQDILSYKYYLKNTKQINGKTINHILTSIRGYNQFAQPENIVVLKDDYFKIQKQYLSPLKVTEKEVLKFLDKIKTNEPKRNYAIICLIANTGLRISELLNLKLNDYNLKTGNCIIRNGKGEKQREITLNSTAIAIIQESLIIRQDYKYSANSEYLFVSQKGEKLDRKTINKIFDDYSKKITPHQLRHFFATNALENMNIYELASQLGHTDIKTTQIYTHVNKEDMRKKMEKTCIGWN